MILRFYFDIIFLNRHSKTGRYLVYCDKLPDNVYFACLEIDEVSTEDAGKYKVQAKNLLGESNATITLNLDSKFILFSDSEKQLYNS